MKHALYIRMTNTPPNGVEIYRMTAPGTAINTYSKHWRVTWLPIHELPQTPMKLTQMLSRYSVVVFPRWYILSDEMWNETQKLIALMKKLNIRVLYEVDDDYTNQYREVAGDAISFAAACDALLVTTSALGKIMGSATGLPYYVLPNSLIRDVWVNSEMPRPERPTDKQVILLSGSRTHYDDWLIMADVLPDLVSRNDVELWLMGFHPDYLLFLPNTRYIDAVSYPEYAQYVGAADIILCPLNADSFNMGKSPIKALEGMGCESVVIASRHPVYELLVQHRKNGLLVEHDNIQAWSDSLIEVIENANLQKKLKKAASRTAWLMYDMQKTYRKWIKAFEDSGQRYAKHPSHKRIQIVE